MLLIRQSLLNRQYDKLNNIYYLHEWNIKVKLKRANYLYDWLINFKGIVDPSKTILCLEVRECRIKHIHIIFM